MQYQDDLFRDANGQPCHLAGTKIYLEEDGTLTLECPHCGTRPVPRHREEALKQFARPRPKPLYSTL